ncbi:ATP-binding protein [Novosphingobium terrae]|uniref:ATP-binding protein n=1 Tax=Novosphingobium terrae TaxID=2726189 RepID=UPI001F1423B6|nr:ATP-binding protein [Novosphingobium terrae]
MIHRLRQWAGHIGLFGRLLALLVLVMAVDFAANALIFEKASDFALHQEDAARLAERLVVADQVLETEPLISRPRVAGELSSETLKISWSPARERPLAALTLAALQGQILSAQPSLAQRNLQLHLSTFSEDIGGSLTLSDGSLVSFHNHSRRAWPLKAGRLISLVLPSLVLVGLALVMMQAILHPLRRLVLATRRVGTSQSSALEPAGPAEVRNLIHAFNAMQSRIDSLLATGAQTMLAIGHDLRTPLARLHLRLDEAPLDPAAREAMQGDIGEMRDLLSSLQTCVEPRSAEPPRRIDIAAMVQTLVDNAQDQGSDASYDGPDTLVVMGRAVPLRRALSNLVTNALHYGGNAEVSLAVVGGHVTVTIADHGPGIPEEELAHVIQPFVRLDHARSRDTPGMGLGLAIVEKSLSGEGATVVLANREGGGLVATVTLAGGAC